MTKIVRATYFKPNGKYHVEDTLYIKEDITEHQAITQEIPPQHEHTDMFMYVEDSHDGKKPFIMPHLYHPPEPKADKKK